MITPIPPLSRTSPTFKAEVNTLFGTTLPNFTVDLNAELERLNTLGFGSYTGTSATSNTIGTGSKSFTIESGKGFVPGQFIVIANTASPSNYMTAQVISYDSETGALVVNATATNGSGTFAAWTMAVSAASGIPTADIQEFTSSGTWTKPSGAKYVYVEIYGGGGGGGSGRRGAAGSNRYGGGGGGGGGFSYGFFAATDLPSSETVTVGAGGAGAPSVTTNTTSGSNGVSGGNSSFGSRLSVGGGVFGGGGGTGNIGSGGAGGASSANMSFDDPIFDGGSVAVSYDSYFGGGGGTGGGISTQSGGGSVLGCGGGGTGGVIDTANNIAGNGANGGSSLSGGGAPNGGVQASGGVGLGRNGGGGGGPNAGGTITSNGGAGSIGGGGGGGAPSTNGTNSGAGGKGGDGFVRVTTFF